MPASAAATPPPGDVLDYIEDMLAELAGLAERIGERKLASSMRLLAIEAARAAPEHQTFRN